MFMKSLVTRPRSRPADQRGLRRPTSRALARPSRSRSTPSGRTPIRRTTGNGLNYQSIGSGGGIKQIKAKTVTFGATDAPLKPKDLDEGRPRAVADGDGRHRARRQSRRGQAGRLLVIDGPTLADIYLGKITNWNDPAIKALNPKARSCPISPSPSSTAPTARARPSTSPTISTRSRRTGSARSA